MAERKKAPLQVRHQLGPFGLVQRQIFSVPITDTALRVYVLLSTYADRTSRKCFPGRRTLAKVLRCSTDTIDRAIKNLELNKVITVSRRKKKSGQNYPNSYTLLVIPAKSGFLDSTEGDGDE